MRWLRLVGSLKLQVSSSKEPYKRDYILQKRPIILRSLLIVATPYVHINMVYIVCRIHRAHVQRVQIYTLHTARTLMCAHMCNAHNVHCINVVSISIWCTLCAGFIGHMYNIHRAHVYTYVTNDQPSIVRITHMTYVHT